MLINNSFVDIEGREILQPPRDSMKPRIQMKRRRSVMRVFFLQKVEGVRAPRNELETAGRCLFVLNRRSNSALIGSPTRFAENQDTCFAELSNFRRDEFLTV